ncbi:dihydropteroate synthase [Thermoplasma sp.]|uniref:dihydropteroate synthase n=1 Tax=Thermoplasma sp. TaxID=1973142 RepID=UPI00126E20A7|nr:dihydropteroate synthase [Thermoplasma sp.]KAA8922343.1 MAG: dihydropteroate synthase [Thermoplasma sp.]
MDGLIIPRRGSHGGSNGKFQFEVYSDRAPPIDHEVIMEGGRRKYIVLADRRTVRDLMEFYSIYPGYEDLASAAIFNALDDKPAIPKIMGIVNATPDSFYPGSRVLGHSDLVFRVIDEKPDILDIGAESTRPGSRGVDPATELERLIPVVKMVRDYSDIPISIDSRHPSVIDGLTKYDINYINDISGFTDKRMIEIAKDSGLNCIIMHMRGTPENMQSLTSYDDIIYDVAGFLADRANELLRNEIGFDRIILDPGIGFAKDTKGNVEILRNIKSLNVGFPILVGTSRKTFIGAITGQKVENRLAGTIGTSIYLAENRVSILRVHDVKENRDALTTYLVLASQGMNAET